MRVRGRSPAWRKPAAGSGQRAESEQASPENRQLWWQRLKVQLARLRLMVSYSGFEAAWSAAGVWDCPIFRDGEQFFCINPYGGLKYSKVQVASSHLQRRDRLIEACHPLWCVE
ncbi:hypothetical protein [Kamptonema formosum]|uniref:hypothetical protein n=1 Tax=Kamptonema formosum TaxID=331992 RepID=UPI00034DFBA6|nr:hypothetical protein [Oscillatoria sp. PCC 10802]